jgi:hypothetical protein
MKRNLFKKELHGSNSLNSFLILPFAAFQQAAGYSAELNCPTV